MQQVLLLTIQHSDWLIQWHLILYKSESLLPKNYLCQIWFDWIIYRRILKCERDYKRHQAILKAHLALIYASLKVKGFLYSADFVQTFLFVSLTYSYHYPIFSILKEVNVSTSTIIYINLRCFLCVLWISLYRFFTIIF